jgi:hypothetical protein
MATTDGLKLDATSELRDLADQAGKLFDKLSMFLIRSNRYGYLPDKLGDMPDDPILTEDFVGTSHEGVTAEQFYATAAFFAGVVSSVDSSTQKVLSRFGKPMSGQ